MNKSDLQESIKNPDLSLYCLVGPNTCGKTHFLNNLFDSLTNALYIHETGEVTVSDNRKRVSIENGKYFYVDDEERGLKRKIESQTDDIEQNASNIVSFSQKTLADIDRSHLSLGTRKMSKILSTFLSYNLNNIKYILFDEPENSLDDKNLKIIAKLLNILQENKFIIVMVTHSPRLLEVLSLDIDNIYVFSRPFEINIKHLSYLDAVGIFDSIGTELKALSAKHRVGIKDFEKYIFLPNTQLRALYLTLVLHSLEFYKTLFYNEIYIVEGLTELYLLREIRSHLPVSNNYFVAGGKFKIPFLIELFLNLNDKVHCFFDTDKKENIDSFSSNLTEYISRKYSDKAKLYYVENDIEAYLSMDKNQISKDLSGDNELSNTFITHFSNRFKEYLCLYLILIDEDAKKKIIGLFRDSTPKNNFDIFD